MSDISLSKAVRSNLLSLQNTASLMATTQERLATGNKVNSALDNPTNFFTASSLNSRASDMNALMDGMSNGIQTLEAADNGLSAITKNLESMQSTLRQARQDKSFQTKSYEVNANSVLKLTGGASLDVASLKLPANTTGSKATVAGTAAYAGPTIAATDDETGAGAGARSIIKYNAAMVGGATDKIKVDGTEIDLSGASDIDTAVTAIDNGLDDAKYSVKKSTDGNIIIENKAVTGSASTAPVVDLGTTAETFGTTTFTYDAARMGTDITIDGSSYTVGGDLASFSAGLQESLGSAYTVSADSDTNEVTVKSTTAGGAAPVIQSEAATSEFKTFSVDAAALGTSTIFGVAMDNTQTTTQDVADQLNADTTFNASYTASVDADSGKLVVSTIATGAAADFTTIAAVNSQGNVTGLTGASGVQGGADAKIAGATGASASYTVDASIAGTSVFGVTLGASDDTAAEVAAKLNADNTFGGTYTASVDNNGKLVVTTNATGASSTAHSQANATGLTGRTVTAGQDAITGATTAGAAGASVTTKAAAADKFTVTYGNTTAQITVDSDGSFDKDETADSINAQLASAGLSGLTASFDADGKLSISAANPEAKALSVTGANASSIFGASATMTDTGEAATNSTDPVDRFVELINTQYKGQLRASNDDGKLRIENLSTQDLDVSVDKNGTGAATLSTIDGNSTRDDLAAQFNDLRDQLDKLADDASFNGINLLRGDKLTLTFNETGTSSIDIQAEDKDGNATSINSLNLGIGALTGSDLDTDSNIDDLLSGLSSALGTIRSLSSTFGSNLSSVQNRQDFTKNMVNTLQTGAANLTLADTNEEAANLLALQTRQQLSSTALSMASQSDQAVLRLF